MPQKSAIDLSVVGKRLPKIDAPDKATGRALYTDDISLPNMIYGKLLLSPVPHARILSVDTSRAKALPGIRVVLTGADVPDVRWGTSPPRYDENVLDSNLHSFGGFIFSIFEHENICIRRSV